MLKDSILTVKLLGFLLYEYALVVYLTSTFINCTLQQVFLFNQETGPAFVPDKYYSPYQEQQQQLGQYGMSEIRLYTNGKRYHICRRTGRSHCLDLKQIVTCRKRRISDRIVRIVHLVPLGVQSLYPIHVTEPGIGGVIKR